MQLRINWKLLRPFRHLASEWEEAFLRNLEDREENQEQAPTQKQVDKFNEVASKLYQRYHDREMCKGSSNFGVSLRRLYNHLSDGKDLTDKQRCLVYRQLVDEGKAPELMAISIHQRFTPLCELKFPPYFPPLQLGCVYDDFIADKSTDWLDMAPADWNEYLNFSIAFDKYKEYASAYPSMEENFIEWLDNNGESRFIIWRIQNYKKDL